MSTVRFNKSSLEPRETDKYLKESYFVPSLILHVDKSSNYEMKLVKFYKRKIWIRSIMIYINKTVELLKLFFNFNFFNPTPYLSIICGPYWSGKPQTIIDLIVSIVIM